MESHIEKDKIASVPVTHQGKSQMDQKCKGNKANHTSTKEEKTLLNSSVVWEWGNHSYDLTENIAKLITFQKIGGTAKVVICKVKR